MTPRRQEAQRACTGLSAICAEQRLTLAAVYSSADRGDSAAVKLAQHIPSGKATAVKIIAESQQNSSLASRDDLTKWES